MEHPAGKKPDTNADGSEQQPADQENQPTTSEMLFDYIRDIIYDTKNAHLDTEMLDAEYRRVGEGLVYFAQFIKEIRHFSDALARGDLTVPVPGRDNELASPLKALHASLRHMTWQSQQVAKGDYKQRIDFMGDFSDAFNTMVEQLDARQRALEKEIETSREKTRALEAAGSLLTNITQKIPQIIVVLGESADQVLYMNLSAEEAIKEDPNLLPQLQQLPCPIEQGGDIVCEIAIPIDDREDECRYYEVQPYSLQWQGQNAQAFVVENVSDRHAHVLRLEKLANWDELTRLHNRHYGMEALQEWLLERRRFTLCFLDLDNLKFVNDTYGHLEGDAYIRAAADLIRDFSEDSLACRLGGDEFMLLVPNATIKDTKPSLEKMCKKFHRSGKQERKAYEPSLSYGLVEVREDNNLPASDILSLADERMYQHKRKHKRQRGGSLAENANEPG